jgi:hypothetical protein
MFLQWDTCLDAVRMNTFHFEVCVIPFHCTKNATCCFLARRTFICAQL